MRLLPDAVVRKNFAGVRGVIVMTDRAHMPADSVRPNLLCYEDLVAAQDEAFDWPEFDENTAASLCYTSGTTGNPKGVCFTAIAQPSCMPMPSTARMPSA